MSVTKDSADIIYLYSQFSSIYVTFIKLLLLTIYKHIQIKTDVNLQVEKGNKFTEKRARNTSLQLVKLLKTIYKSILGCI